MRNTVVIALLVAACGAFHAKRQNEYGAGTEVYKLEGTFQVEVTRVRVNGHKLEVKFVFTNLADGALRFLRSDVALAYGDKTVTPREAWGGGERDVDFHRRGQQKRKTYIFTLESRHTDIASGDYEITFAGFFRNGSGSAEGVLKFPLKVP